MKNNPKVILSYGLVVRHATAIERLRAELLDLEGACDRLDTLSRDAANLVYAFLIANGNDVPLDTRDLREDVAEAILQVLGKHGITAETLKVCSIIPR